MTPRDSNGAIVNALTIDVEDYFQVSAFEPHIARSDWDQLPCRIERNVDRILELLDANGAHATFFTLGWIAQRYPTLVRKIGAAGHEIASHGSSHRRAHEQGRSEFASDIANAKKLLEDLCGTSVRGYRAPSFSIGPANPWAFECIANAGYRYSSSVYPIAHDHYGAPQSPRFAHEVMPGLLELPVATVRMWSRNWPAGGGGYFRLLPYRVSRWSLARINGVDRRPAMFYLHPWELDPEQPRVAGVSAKTRFRHYLNLGRTKARLTRLLRDFRWDRVDRVYLDGVA
ncbi:MAG TPA: XrtA system polysaccharide deacetylase [Casimicrobiaceae bacterium]|nr:XrtA system polysaccharide deacetylase [Casimicrobiaceae bacterium]